MDGAGEAEQEPGEEGRAEAAAQQECSWLCGPGASALLYQGCRASERS